MVIEQSEHIVSEVKKAFIGNDEVIRKVLMTIYAGGHVLLEDCPGVGKTTLALAFSKALGLDFKRIQFTTDTMPSDITGFSIFNRQSGQFEYQAGAVACNILLADEINRTSPKTQAALLEAMEEKSVTVDGVTRQLLNPFICIATQNPLGSAGTHPLPESELDRFMVRLSIGYPSMEDQIKILNTKKYRSPLDDIKATCSAEDIVEVQNYLLSITLSEDVMKYAIELCEATRSSELIELGISPRGIIALTQMAKASALIESRSYVVPEDIQRVFIDTCAHRLVLRPQAYVDEITAEQILTGILDSVKPPVRLKGYKNG